MERMALWGYTRTPVTFLLFLQQTQIAAGDWRRRVFSADELDGSDAQEKQSDGDASQPGPGHFRQLAATQRLLIQH